jgi:CRISPR-associated protein Csc1
MHIYRGELELLDYVFYATTERGSVHETGGFIHNYALAYALGLVRSVPYTNLTQQPRYEEELTPLNGQLYITPAAPQRVAYSTVQWNTLRESYGIPKKQPSLGYPDWGFARMLRPGSRFTFYVLISDQGKALDAPALSQLLQGNPVRVRLGKFMAKARMQLRRADRVTERTEAFFAESYLNWRDLAEDPEFCDVVVASRPTRLISRAQFSAAPHYEARFGEDIIRLPANMRFLARPPGKQATSTTRKPGAAGGRKTSSKRKGRS